jgi:hypothetical protein
VWQAGYQHLELSNHHKLRGVRWWVNIEDCNLLLSRHVFARILPKACSKRKHLLLPRRSRSCRYRELSLIHIRHLQSRRASSIHNEVHLQTSLLVICFPESGAGAEAREADSGSAYRPAKLSRTSGSDFGMKASS